MTSRRYGRVEQIFQSALAKTLAEREAFLDETCAGDPTLRREVEARLSSARREGTTISHYRLVEKLGEGGMGEVYLAHDLRLRRKVALKLLPERITRDEESRLRFIREAQAAAAIGHPNIAAIHEIDEVGEQTFIAMEYVQGRSLREVLADDRLSVERALQIGAQLADALATIHEKGVLHRDLKPENVLISDKGHPRIIDFGIAKLLEAPSGSTDPEPDGPRPEAQMKTKEDVLLGTVTYMSPEQAKGARLDARSDIFSFGVLLYEMIAGRSPFRRPTRIETATAILHDPAGPISLPDATVSRELDRILQRALAKRPEDRYQTAQELADDLQGLRAELDERKGRSASARAALPIGLALVVAVALGIWWSGGEVEGPAARPREPLSILIADFENHTGDSVFDGVLEQSLAIGLEEAPFITCYARSLARRAASRIDPGSGGDLGREMAQLVGRSEGVGLLVTGSIESAGGGYALRAEVFDVVSSARLDGAERIAETKTEVLPAVQDLAAALRARLGDAETRESRGFVTTSSLEALHSFVKGQELLQEGRYAEAKDAYRSAIALDPGFGSAYAGLAVLLYNQGLREEAERSFSLALARMDRMSRREKRRTRGGYFVLAGNYPKAVEEFEALVEEFPGDWAGYGNLALALFYMREMAGAVEHGRKAVELYPSNVIFRNNLALYEMYAGQFHAAVRDARAVLRDNPGFAKAHLVVALSQLALGDPEEAAASYRELSELSDLGASLAGTGLADLALFRGRLSEARKVLTEAVESERAAGRREAAASKLALLAQTQVALGRPQAARRALEQALQASERPDVLVSAARAYLALGDSARALELASDLSASLRPGRRAYADLIEGEAELGRGRAAAAVEEFRDSLELDDTWLGRLGLARAYLEAGAYAEAYAELEACLDRRGEAVSVFLDDFPSYRHFAAVPYYVGRAQEGLGSPAAAESYREFLAMKEGGDETRLVADARRRLEALR